MVLQPFRPVTGAPDAIVCVVRFDKTVGPVLAWSTFSPSPQSTSTDTSNDVDTVLFSAIENSLPHFVLPEGASSRRRVGNTTRVVGSAEGSSSVSSSMSLEIKNESRFVLPVRCSASSSSSSSSGGEVLFGVAVYVVVNDNPGSSNSSMRSRGATQFAVVLLTRAPSMALERLRSVVPVFVRAQFDNDEDDDESGGGEGGDREDNGAEGGSAKCSHAGGNELMESGSVSEGGQQVLMALHASVSHQRSAVLGFGVQDLGAQVAVVRLLGRRLRHHCWPLLRLVLLEGRVLLYSRSASRASACCWALASLLPGLVSAGLGHDPDTPGASDVPRFRWRRFGLPLQCFHSECTLAPLVPISDAARVFEHRGYLAGTANGMVAHHMHALSRPDAVLDLDSGMLTRTPYSQPTPPATATTLAATPSRASSFGTASEIEAAKAAAAAKAAKAAKAAAVAVAAFFDAQQRRVTAALDGASGEVGGRVGEMLEVMDRQRPHYKARHAAAALAFGLGGSSSSSSSSSLFSSAGSYGGGGGGGGAGGGGSSGSSGSSGSGLGLSGLLHYASAAATVAATAGVAATLASATADPSHAMINGGGGGGGGAGGALSQGGGGSSDEEEMESNINGSDGESGGGRGEVVNSGGRQEGDEWEGSDGWLHAEMQRAFEGFLLKADDAIAQDAAAVAAAVATRASVGNTGDPRRQQQAQQHTSLAQTSAPPTAPGSLSLLGGGGGGGGFGLWGGRLAEKVAGSLVSEQSWLSQSAPSLAASLTSSLAHAAAAQRGYTANNSGNGDGAAAGPSFESDSGGGGEAGGGNATGRGSGNDGGGMGGGMVCIEALLAPVVGIDFAFEWRKTENFRKWRQGCEERSQARKRRNNNNNPSANGRAATVSNHGAQNQSQQQQQKHAFESRRSSDALGGESGGVSTDGGSHLVATAAAGLVAAATSALLGSSDSSQQQQQQQQGPSSSSSFSSPPWEGRASFVDPVSGDRYDGEWHAGKRHGCGLRVVKVSGARYDGEWVEGLEHGEGSFTSGGDDFIYDGQWKRGQRTGKGRAVWQGRRESYTGDFLQGEFHGHGVFCDSSGSVYEGEWRKGKRHGVGTLTRHFTQLASSSPSPAAAAIAAPVSETTLPSPSQSSVGVGVDSRDGVSSDGGVSSGDSGGARCVCWTGEEGVQEVVVAAAAAAAAAAALDTKKQLHVSGGAVCSGGPEGDDTGHLSTVTLLSPSPTSFSSASPSSGSLRWGCYLTGLPWVRYSGEWKAGLRQGIGTCVFLDGSKYSGPWAVDEPNGEGTWLAEVPFCQLAEGTQPQGSTSSGSGGGGREGGEGGGGVLQVKYEGEWVQGLRHGEGSEQVPVLVRCQNSHAMTSSSSVPAGNIGRRSTWWGSFTREGRWDKGSAQLGDWRFTWVPSSSSSALSSSSSPHPYSGAADLEMHTQQQTTGGSGGGGSSSSRSSSNSSSTRSYVGQAGSDALGQGVGTMKFKESGAVYSGEWHRGLRHGQGVCVYSDGSYHKGSWRQDEPLNKELTFEEVSLDDGSNNLHDSYGGCGGYDLYLNNSSSSSTSSANANAAMLASASPPFSVGDGSSGNQGSGGGSKWREPKVTAQWPLGDESVRDSTTTSSSSGGSSSTTAPLLLRAPEMVMNGDSALSLYGDSDDGDDKGAVGLGGLAASLCLPTLSRMGQQGLTAPTRPTDHHPALLLPRAQSLPSPLTFPSSTAPFPAQWWGLHLPVADDDAQARQATAANRPKVWRLRTKLVSGGGELQLCGEWRNLAHLTAAPAGPTTPAGASAATSTSAAGGGGANAQGNGGDGSLADGGGGGNGGNTVTRRSLLAAAASSSGPQSRRVVGWGKALDGIGGLEYEGDWVEGVPHGKGTFTKRAVVVGDARNQGVEKGEKEGGCCDVPSFEWQYVGEFRRGRPHGVGTLRKASAAASERVGVEKGPLPKTAELLSPPLPQSSSSSDWGNGDLVEDHSKNDDIGGSEDDEDDFMMPFPTSQGLRRPSAAAAAAAAAAGISSSMQHLPQKQQQQQQQQQQQAGTSLSLAATSQVAGVSPPLPLPPPHVPVEGDYFVSEEPSAVPWDPNTFVLSEEEAAEEEGEVAASGISGGGAMGLDCLDTRGGSGVYGDGTGGGSPAWVVLQRAMHEMAVPLVRPRNMHANNHAGPNAASTTLLSCCSDEAAAGEGCSSSSSSSGDSSGSHSALGMVVGGNNGAHGGPSPSSSSSSSSSCAVTTWVSYSGEWHSGCMSGVGTMLFSDGSTFSGQWRPQAGGGVEGTTRRGGSGGGGVGETNTHGDQGEVEKREDSDEEGCSEVGAECLRRVAHHFLSNGGLRNSSSSSGGGNDGGNGGGSAALSLPEGEGTYTFDSSSSSSGASSSSTTTSSGGGGGSGCRGKPSWRWTFEGRWVGGAAHGIGTFTVIYDYCVRAAPSTPLEAVVDCDGHASAAIPVSVAADGTSSGDGKLVCLSDNARAAAVLRRGRRQEVREGRWHRGAPLDGEWQFRWSEEEKVPRAAAGTAGAKRVQTAAVSRQQRGGARARARGGGQYMGQALSMRPHGQGVCKYPSSSPASSSASSSSSASASLASSPTHGAAGMSGCSSSASHLETGVGGDGGGGGGGSVYTGSWVHGLRSGHGSCVWTSGADYTGLWEADRIATFADCSERKKGKGEGGALQVEEGPAAAGLLCPSSETVGTLRLPDGSIHHLPRPSPPNSTWPYSYPTGS